MNKQQFCDEFHRPLLAVDCVVFGLDEKNSLKILLIRRAIEPFQGSWALPGGFVQTNRDKSLESTVRRELQEETGVDLSAVFLEQFHTFGSSTRDPRDWAASVAYYVLVNIEEYSLEASTDADKASWVQIHELPTLAFDHELIIQKAVQRLQRQVRYEPIGFELLPQKFTLSQLQGLYEAIFNQQIDKRNFFRKIRKMNFLTELDETQSGVSHRPAKLYQFDENKYNQLKAKGFNFEI